jgi:hypothetical protein
LVSQTVGQLYLAGVEVLQHAPHRAFPPLSIALGTRVQFRAAGRVHGRLVGEPAELAARNGIFHLPAALQIDRVGEGVGFPRKL